MTSPIHSWVPQRALTLLTVYVCAHACACWVLPLLLQWSCFHSPYPLDCHTSIPFFTLNVPNTLVWRVMVTSMPIITLHTSSDIQSREKGNSEWQVKRERRVKKQKSKKMRCMHILIQWTQKKRPDVEADIMAGQHTEEELLHLFSRHEKSWESVYLRERWTDTCLSSIIIITSLQTKRQLVTHLFPKLNLNASATSWVAQGQLLAWKSNSSIQFQDSINFLVSFTSQEINKQWVIGFYISTTKSNCLTWVAGTFLFYPVSGGHHTHIWPLSTLTCQVI